MDKEQAKLILQAIRPGIDDEADPEIAEALALAETDEEVAAFLAREQAFDAAFAGQLATVEPPAGLRERILKAAAADEAGGSAGTAGESGQRNDTLADVQKERDRAAPAPQERRQGWLRPLYALAACIVIVLGLALVVERASTPAQPANGIEDGIEGFYAFAAEHARSMPPLQMRSEDMDEIRSFLASHNMPNVGKLPGEMAAMGGLGCRTLYYNIDGREVPVGSVCIGEDNVHHIYIISKDAFPAEKLPVAPHFEQRGDYAMASWSSEDRLYVLFARGTTEQLERLI